VLPALAGKDKRFGWKIKENKENKSKKQAYQCSPVIKTGFVSDI
jgi:hypothetical protein